MAYGKRTSIDRINRRLRRENGMGYEPEGPWWKKALATIIALLLVVVVFAVIFFIGSL